MDKREFTTLTAEVSGAIGHLVLNRPERLNAINDAVMTEMLEAVSWFDRHPELRVVVFKGVGRAFSAGADGAKHGGTSIADQSHHLVRLV